MSKEPPTKKQLYYYERLCKKYNIEKIELSSKLEAKNMIDKIITEHNSDYKLIYKKREVSANTRYCKNFNRFGNRTK